MGTGDVEELRKRVKDLKEEKFDLLKRIDRLESSIKNMRTVAVNAFEEADFWEKKADYYRDILEFFLNGIQNWEPEDSDEWDREMREELEDLKAKITDVKEQLK